MKIDALTQNKTTPDINVENPNWEKPQDPTDSNYHYERKNTKRDSKVTTSSSMSTPMSNYNREYFLFLSHTFSLCVICATITTIT